MPSDILISIFKNACDLRYCLLNAPEHFNIDFYGSHGVDPFYVLLDRYWSEDGEDFPLPSTQTADNIGFARYFAACSPYIGIPPTQWANTLLYLAFPLVYKQYLEEGRFAPGYENNQALSVEEALIPECYAAYEEGTEGFLWLFEDLLNYGYRTASLSMVHVAACWQDESLVSGTLQEHLVAGSIAYISEPRLGSSSLGQRYRGQMLRLFAAMLGSASSVLEHLSNRYRGTSFMQCNVMEQPAIDWDEADVATTQCIVHTFQIPQVFYRHGGIINDNFEGSTSAPSNIRLILSSSGTITGRSRSPENDGPAIQNIQVINRNLSDEAVRRLSATRTAFDFERQGLHFDTSEEVRNSDSDTSEEVRNSDFNLTQYERDNIDDPDA